MNTSTPWPSDKEPMTQNLTQVSVLEPLVGTMMEWFAYLAPSGFPKAILFRFADRLPAPLASLSPEKFLTLFDLMDKAGLVIHAKTEVHLFAPVLKVVQETLPIPRIQHAIQNAGRVLLATLATGDTSPMGHHEINRLAWHVQMLAANALKSQDTSLATQLLQWLDRAGRLLIDPWPDRAINAHQSALNLSRQILGSHHPLTITRLNNLGETWRRLGEFSQAEQCLLSALSLQQQHLKGHRHLQANCLGNLGLLKMDQNQLADARNNLTQAWSFASVTRGLDDPLVFLCINNLAKIGTILNDNEHVIQLIHQALARHNKVSRIGSHLNIAIILNNLAIVENKAGHLEVARETSRKAAAMARHCLPNGHPQLTRFISQNASRPIP
ncbi:MAG: tetratricopeptide repeat protein [Magnetococcales bacterium]|nr:tetratricopeptide repeat protein [Magnetococcales bacterium]